jgi:biopolymer transport protein TolR
MSEINVVPYIDVSLVLLVIFMITAPLLSQGVKVELPKTSSRPLSEAQKEPVVISVDSKGRYYLNIGEKTDKPIDDQTLVNRVAAVRRQRPTASVLVRGDTHVDYGAVVQVMSLLQQAGVDNIGLITERPEDQ